MNSLSSHRTCQLYLCLKASLLLLTVLSLGVCVVWAQTSDLQIASSQARIGQDLELIRAAEQEHLSAAERGAMWARLAREYHNAADFLKAEDAYNKSLRLLKTEPSARAEYAATLDNLDYLYLIYGRLDDAESVRKQALAVFQKWGSLSDIGYGQVHLADIALARHQFKKAERLALRGIQGMESSSNPPKVGMLSGLITLTYARCARGNCGEGLRSAEQAVAFANRNFGSESVAAGGALGALGFAESKTGAAEDGEKAMLQSIRILQTKLAPADPRVAFAMMQYRAYLVGANRRVEAQEIQEQVTRMNSQAGVFCASCAVSVNSLSNSMR
jgi:tetratricopeptide (TPR) repeat protein